MIFTVVGGGNTTTVHGLTRSGGNCCFGQR